MTGTLSKLSPRRRDRAKPTPLLFVALECGAPMRAPLRQPLAEVDVLELGRGPRREITPGKADRHLRLDVPDERMSSTHARLWRVGTSWICEDLGSKNGSLVNGVRAERTRLSDGAILELGHTLLLYRDRHAIAGHDAALDGEAPSDAHPSLRSLCSSLSSDFERLARVASSAVPVVVRGESGTGKELVARAVHELSGRRGRFVAVNCGSLVESLVQSELFGYRRGAFSGAVEDRLGLVRAAEGGTLFLDEIGDMPLAAQAVLLRVLQEREVQPLGATEAVAVDMRIVAATHRDLDAMMDDGDFRHDLYARLAGFSFRLPPLCERTEDIGLLVASLLGRHASRAGALSFTPEAARALFAYSWPLNVRELEHCLARAIAIADEGLIDLDHLPREVAESLASMVKPPVSDDELSDEERSLRDRLMAALQAHGGNVSAVARALDKDRKQIHRWAERFGIDLGGFRG